jgi:hypothetical protein
MSLMTWKLPRHTRSAGGVGKYCARLRMLAAVCAGLVAVLAASEALAARVCKPRLAISNPSLSDMQPPFNERRWTAIVSADASQCATAAGYFDIGISRQKENSLDLEFREQLIWSAPKSLIGFDFWADEAVGAYWIDSIQACPCAREDLANSGPVER